MPRLLAVYGTRPEAIKMAPIVRAFEADPAFDHGVAVTGQHRGMLDQVNELFGIIPRFDLDVMTDRQRLLVMSARILERLDAVLDDFRPDGVLVQGDTSTSTMAALSAFYHAIPVFHIEAGLRSGDLASPFPEEGNRRVTGQLAARHFAPTAIARDNLMREGVASSDILVTGNSVIDALLDVVARPVEFQPALAAALASGRRVLLVTSHRRESWDGGIAATARAVRRLLDDFPDLQAIVPLHRNPVVRAAFADNLPVSARATVIDPLDYHEFAALMARSHLILSDSGGVQEEAPSLGKPVLVTRDTTERPEGVVAGTVLLVGSDEDRIVREATRLLRDDDAYQAMSRTINPYGDGRAAERIVAGVREFFALGSRQSDFLPA